MSEETLVEVAHLSRDYGTIHAVRDISFKVERGEVLGFLGPNGAGKTTTMQMLAGILAPSAGSVRIGGADILDEPRKAKRRLGYLPEIPPLYRDLTVDEFLLFCASLHGVSRHERSAQLARAKQRCGLDEVGSRLIANLSKGYQQRVGIAQAILHGPAVVILDEPTVGLDPIQIREIRALIRELRDDHSVILSTHILPEVQSVCDRVLIIAQGRLVLNESMSALNARQHAESLRIKLARPPLIEGLQRIPGVHAVEDLGERCFRLRFPASADPAQIVVERSVVEGWGLQELTPERRTLEETFVQLAHGEGAAAVTTTASEGVKA
jgi:ABC-2 type transport system ATP-binding protein